MTPEQIKLVQDSYMLLKSSKVDIADVFYKRLFEIAPEARPLFSEDIEEQKVKFSMTLNATLLNLRNLQFMITSIRELGKRHVDYGVPISMFGPVKNAFFWTLEQALGEQFSGEMKAAWLETYNALEQTMKEGMTE